MIEFLRWLPPVAYGLVASLYLARFLHDPEDEPLPSWSWSALHAVLVHLAVLVVMGAARSRLPFASMGEALSVSCLVLAASYVVVERLARTEALGVFFLIPVALGTGISAALPLSQVWPPHLRTILFAIHASTGATALACLFASSLLAGAYLLQYRQLERRRFGGLARRLPDLPTLDRFFHLCASCGTVLLVCSVGVGAIWIHQWSLSLEGAVLKTFLVCLAVVWYSVIGLLRQRQTFTARTSARLAMIGGIIVVSVLLAGTHG